MSLIFILPLEMISNITPLEASAQAQEQNVQGSPEEIQNYMDLLVSTLIVIFKAE